MPCLLPMGLRQVIAIRPPAVQWISIPDIMALVDIGWKPSPEIVNAYQRYKARVRK